MRTAKFGHPECRRNEKFVGNTTHINGVPYLMELKTARLGINAYSIDGKAISPDYMRPLFIGNSEWEQYDRIMVDRCKNG
jgi:hypothetical protein